MAMLMTKIIIWFMLPMFIMLMATTLSKNQLLIVKKDQNLNVDLTPKVQHEYHSSIQIYLIAVIFLIFDVERALILPIVIIMKTSNIKVWTMSTMLIIIYLLLFIIIISFSSSYYYYLLLLFY